MIPAVKTKHGNPNKLFLYLKETVIYMKIEDINKSSLKKSSLKIVEDISIFKKYQNYATNSALAFYHSNSISNILTKKEYSKRKQEVSDIFNGLAFEWSILGEKAFIAMFISKKIKNKGFFYYMSDPFANKKVSMMYVTLFQENFTKSIINESIFRNGRKSNLDGSEKEFDLFEYESYNKKEITSAKFLVRKSNNEYIDVTEALKSVYHYHIGHSTNSFWELIPEQDMIKRSSWHYWYNSYNHKIIYLFTIKLYDELRVWKAEKIITNDGKEYYLLLDNVPNILVTIIGHKQNSKISLGTLLGQS